MQKKIIAFVRGLLRNALILSSILVEETLALRPLRGLILLNRARLLKNTALVLSLIGASFYALAALFGLLANLLNFTYQLILLMKNLGVIGTILLL